MIKYIYINGTRTNYTIDEHGVIRNSQNGHIKKFYCVDNSAKVSLCVNGKNVRVKVANIMIDLFMNLELNSLDVILYKDKNCMNVSLENLIVLNQDEYLLYLLNMYFVQCDNFYIIKSGNMTGELWTVLKLNNTKVPYMISNHGRVFSLKSAFFVRPILSRKYPYICIRDENGKCNNLSIHRLVALYFVKNDNPELKTIVHHIDHNIFNYHFTNLMWCTTLDNALFEVSDDKTKHGENHPNSTINDDVAESICQFISHGYRVCDICKILNVSRYVVQKIKSGKSWTHVSRKYQWGKYPNVMTFDQQIGVIQSYCKGIPFSQISSDLNVSNMQCINCINSFRQFTDKRLIKNAIMTLYDQHFTAHDIAIKMHMENKEIDIQNIIDKYTQ